MNKQDVTRALIELAVDQGIRDMKINSHRSIRRMADLGRQFAKGRFQDRIFSLFQGMLSREDSPYYDMIDQLLGSIDPAYFKHFGINIGYNGWTYGASLLRKKEADAGERCPWVLRLSWNPSSTLTLQDISTLIRENKKNGTYCYSIRIKGTLDGNTALFDLFSDCGDCAFLLDLTRTDCSLTVDQLRAVRQCPNLMLLLPEESPNCHALSQALSDQRSLFAISRRYRADEADRITDPLCINEMLSYGSVILILSADDGCTAEVRKKAGDSVLEARMSQKYPAILVEWDSDIERVNHIIYQQNPAPSLPPRVLPAR